MKPERALTAERPLARHCPELLREGPGSADLLPLLAAAGDRLAGQLAVTLAPVTGHGKEVQVTAAAPRMAELADITRAAGAPRADALVRLGERGHAVLSISGRAVLGLLDRAFGGSGRVSDPLPEKLPVSAQLLADRIAQAVCQALQETLPDAPAALASGAGDAAPLFGIAPAAPMIALDFTVSAGPAEPWQLTLAIEEAALPGLLGPGRGRPSGAQTARIPNDPLAGPFAAMPLALRATLIDMQVPFSTVASLEPGMMLPVAVARSIPLSIGGKTIARGSIGALDERVAVQITDITGS